MSHPNFHYYLSAALRRRGLSTYTTNPDAFPPADLDGDCPGLADFRERFVAVSDRVKAANEPIERAEAALKTIDADRLAAVQRGDDVIPSRRDLEDALDDAQLAAQEVYRQAAEDMADLLVEARAKLPEWSAIPKRRAAIDKLRQKAAEMIAQADEAEHLVAAMDAWAAGFADDSGGVASGRGFKFCLQTITAQRAAMARHAANQAAALDRVTGGARVTFAAGGRS